ncbi:hypothetical protein BJ912DRAFT_981839, partial [Pholiota molesta]
SATYISLLWLVRASKAASIGALIFQSLELFNHIPEEIEYLWRTPFRLMTCLYALSRYFPLCVQIANIALSELVYASSKPGLCFFTFIVKGVSAQLITTCIEAILVIRVHALYNCNRRTGLFLLSIMIIGTTLEATGTALTFLHMRPGPKASMCTPQRCPVQSVIAFVLGASLIQATLLVMTLSRIILYRQTGWMRTPVVSLMLRDGVIVFLVLTIIIAVFTAVEMVSSDNMLLFDVVYSWYVALLSIAGCRLVLNMRKLAVQHPRIQQSISFPVELSTFFGDQTIFAPGDLTAYS